METSGIELVLPAGCDPAAIVDLRGLEAPEPMVIILESAMRLGQDERFIAHLPHVPHPLFPHLEARSLAWEIFEQKDGSALVVIRRAP